MTKTYTRYFRTLFFLLLMFGSFLFLSKTTSQYAQSANCSLNIYPQPVNGTNDYTVTFTHNNSTPFKGFLNNWYGGNDTIGNGGTGSINSRTYPSGWTPLNSQTYEIKATNSTGAQQVVYQLNLTLNNGFGGIDVGASSDEAFSSYDLCSGHLSPSEITYNNIPRLNSLSPAKIWIGLKNGSDNGIKFDLKAEVYVNGNLVTDGQIDSVPGGGSSFNNALENTINFNSFSATNFSPGSSLSVKLYVRNACVGSGKNSGFARLYYNDSLANSRFGGTIDSTSSTYYLTSGSALSTSVGVGPRQNIDIESGAQCSSFKLFDTWTINPSIPTPTPTLTPTPTPTPTLTPTPTPIVQNCSINIYPQPVNGTNDYTVTFTHNGSSTPFKDFLNNWYGGNDTIGNGGTGSINSRTYPSGWTPLHSQSYEVRASNSTGAQQVVYQLNLTLNNGFGGIDVGASSDETIINYDLCSGHLSPSDITYNQ